MSKYILTDEAFQGLKKVIFHESVKPYTKHGEALDLAIFNNVYISKVALPVLYYRNNSDVDYWPIGMIESNYLYTEYDPHSHSSITFYLKPGIDIHTELSTFIENNPSLFARTFKTILTYNVADVSGSLSQMLGTKKLPVFTLTVINNDPELPDLVSAHSAYMLNTLIMYIFRNHAKGIN